MRQHPSTQEQFKRGNAGLSSLSQVTVPPPTGATPHSLCARAADGKVKIANAIAPAAEPVRSAQVFLPMAAVNRRLWL